MHLIALLLIFLSLYSIFLDFKLFKNLFSPFSWLHINTLLVFILPIFSYGNGVYAEYFPGRQFNEEYTWDALFPLVVQMCSFSFFYFASVSYFKINKVIQKFEGLDLKLGTNFLFFGITCVFMIAFLDLFFLWIKNPHIAGIYYKMKGHGWANLIVGITGLYFFLPLIASKSKIRYFSIVYFLLFVFSAAIFQGRMTQMTRLSIVVAIILLDPFKSVLNVKFILGLVLIGFLTFVGIRIVEYLGSGEAFTVHQFFNFFKGQNFGLFQDLVLNFYYAPENLFLGPEVFLRDIPFLKNYFNFDYFNFLYNGGVESWVLGIKKSSAGGMPFTHLAVNYFSSGLLGVSFWAMINALILSALAVVMRRWADREVKSPNDVTLGFYAVIWYILPGFSMPMVKNLGWLFFWGTILWGWPNGEKWIRKKCLSFLKKDL